MRSVRLEGPRGTSWMIDLPDSRRERMRGLRHRDGLGPREALLFTDCRSVHSFGMRFPILVAGLDRDMHVRRLWTLSPRRLIMPRAGIQHMLETAADAQIVVGDRLVRPETGWSEV